jgi:hypothetical protein
MNHPPGATGKREATASAMKILTNSGKLGIGWPLVPYREISAIATMPAERRFFGATTIPCFALAWPCGWVLGPDFWWLYWSQANGAVGGRGRPGLGGRAGG